MKPFEIPGGGSRLIIHEGTVYKIKLVYVSRNQDSNEGSLPCDPRTIQQELQEAIRVILSGTLTPMKTDHFVISAAKKSWKLASCMVFLSDTKRLKAYPSTLIILVQPRQDLLDQSDDRQKQQSPQTALTRRRGKHSWSVRLNEEAASSPPPPKKPRSCEKRKSPRSRSSREQGTRQRRSLLHHRITEGPGTPGKQRARGPYHLRSQGLQAATQAKDQGEKLGPKGVSQDASLTSNEAGMTRQDRQEYDRGRSQVCQAEPRVGVTPAAESRPAYPQGGAVQHGIRAQQQPGRFEEEQYQLDEQMRLQRLAGNQPTHPQPPLPHYYQLRPRGTLQQVVSAVLTPIRNLFPKSH